MRHTPKGQLFTDIVLATFKLNGLLVAEGDLLTQELGLTSARWKVLGAVALAGNPMTVPQIAHTMGQTRQGVQRLTDVLQKDGLLSYQDNPLHKRARLVALTAKGKETYARLEQKQIPWSNRHADKLSMADLRATLGVLQTMVQLFES